MGDDASWNRNDEIENGHVPSLLSPFNLQNSSSSSEEEETVMTSFNIDLPTSHTYLGKLKNLGGYTLFDDGEILSLIGMDTNTLVLPDFTLPLIFDNPHDGSLMEHFLKKSKVFVLLCTHYSKPSEYFEYGVTMEVVETSVCDGILSLKAIGRQRCQVISEIKPLSEKLQTVLVKILPEYKITSPLVDTQLYTLKLKRPYFCKDYSDMKSLRKYRRYHAAQFTFPDWLYEEYEVCYFVKHILEGLKKFFIMEFVPKDPLKLSYWFVQNYLLQYEERLRLLQQDTVLSRLRLEMKYIKKNRLILCQSCHQQISEQQNIIVLSKDGLQNNFVNPGGHVYETVTVNQAKNFSLIGRPSRKFSWFPGYAWTIMQCRQCRSHLGWKFTSNTYLPMFFFGLATSSIVVKNEKEGDNE